LVVVDIDYRVVKTLPVRKCEPQSFYSRLERKRPLADR